MDNLFFINGDCTIEIVEKEEEPAMLMMRSVRRLAVEEQTTRNTRIVNDEDNDGEVIL